MTVHAQLVSRLRGQRLLAPPRAPDAHLPSHLVPPPHPAEFEDYMDGKYQFETDSAAVGITLRCLVGAGPLRCACTQCRAGCSGAEAALRSLKPHHLLLLHRLPAAGGSCVGCPLPREAAQWSAPLTAPIRHSPLLQRALLHLPGAGGLWPAQVRQAAPEQGLEQGQGLGCAPPPSTQAAAACRAHRR